jgi:prepilin-type N-terminal cleavage/methylation domain-containing protein
MSRRSAMRGLPCFPRSASARSATRGGFTLLEILVVLGIFGLISALVIGTSESMLKAATKEDAENAALDAIASARTQAVLSGQVVELRVDEKARALDWGTGRTAIAGEDMVGLLPMERAGAMLIGGRLQETKIPSVKFYPDGTCDAFRLEITRGANRSIQPIDPWTCTALAATSKPGAR